MPSYRQNLSGRIHGKHAETLSLPSSNTKMASITLAVETRHFAGKDPLIEYTERE